MALAIISACELLADWLNVGATGVFIIEAQLLLPALYGESMGMSAVWGSGATSVVVCRFDELGFRGDRSPADGGGCMNCPIAGIPEEDFGRVLAVRSGLRELHGERGGGCGVLSPPFPAGVEIDGVTRDGRWSKTALFLLEEGGLPVCCVNLAFSVAMAATASGNIAFILSLSRPDCLLVEEDIGGRDRGLRGPSTFSLFAASAKRFDIGSIVLSEGLGIDFADGVSYLCRSWPEIEHQTSGDSCPFVVGLG